MFKNPFATKSTLELAQESLVLAERALLTAQSRLEHAKADVVVYTEQVSRLREIINNGGLLKKTPDLLSDAQADNGTYNM